MSLVETKSPLSRYTKPLHPSVVDEAELVAQDDGA